MTQTAGKITVKENSLLDPNHPSIKLQKFFIEKGLAIDSGDGSYAVHAGSKNICCTESFGIMKKPGLFQRLFENGEKIADASVKTGAIELKVYGVENVQPIKDLAEELAEKFKLEITIELATEKSVSASSGGYD